jgi:hypothetical protein
MAALSPGKRAHPLQRAFGEVIVVGDRASLNGELAFACDDHKLHYPINFPEITDISQNSPLPEKVYRQ